MLRAIALFIAASALAAQAEALRGSAILDGPVAPSEGLILEATVSDVSRADAPSILLAGITFQTVDQPRYDFMITYDPAVLQPQAVYALRVTLSRDGRLVATTDTHYPVLKDGKPDEVPVEVILHPVN
jgi:putative lipoprotein